MEYEKQETDHVNGTGNLHAGNGQDATVTHQNGHKLSAEHDRSAYPEQQEELDPKALRRAVFKLDCVVFASR